MAPIIPRMHLFEIDDQPWFPPFLRAGVQAVLTLFWTLHVPIIQPEAPATLAARVLNRVIHQTQGDDSEVIVWDFCAGAGGPTPSIARSVAAQIAAGSSRGYEPASVRFVLSDIAPHRAAWELAATQNPGIVGYIPESVDATAASVEALSHVVFAKGSNGALAPASLHEVQSRSNVQDEWDHADSTLRLRHIQPPADGPGPKTRILRLFNLAFHHFDEAPARQVIRDTLATADGFVIFELVGRDIPSWFTMVMALPAQLLFSPFAFWGDWVHLFFTYVIPVIPFVIVFDGFMSSLRIRTGEEAEAMVQSVIQEVGHEKVGHWTVKWGSEWHTYPTGRMEWIVAMKDEHSE